MSDSQIPTPERETTSKGPNLFVLYAVLALAILAAMGVAAMIVWPFYKSIKP